MKILATLPMLIVLSGCNFEIKVEIEPDVPDVKISIFHTWVPGTRDTVATGYEIVGGKCLTGRKHFETKDEFCESLRGESGTDCEKAALSIRASEQCDPESQAWADKQEGITISHVPIPDSDDGCTSSNQVGLMMTFAKRRFSVFA
jgi:hypothetical protein